MYSIGTLSTAPAAAPEDPKLPAPLWHTGLVLLYVLVPFSWWPGSRILARAIPYNRGALDIFGICSYAVVVGFVCFGLSRHHTPLEDLLGKTWTRWRDALRDVAIAAGFWLVVYYADKLIYYLAPWFRPAPRLQPHTKPELLISILLAIVAGVAEELIFRGYLQRQFTILCDNLGAGLLVQAALFACYHGYNQTPANFGQHFVFALLAGLLAHWRRSLLPGMIGHVWFDIYISAQRFLRPA